MEKLALLGRRACFFIKLTLFSLSEIRSVVFCGPQIYGSRCWQSSGFEGDGKRAVVSFSRKKCTLIASVAPNAKSWLHAWLRGPYIGGGVVTAGYDSFGIFQLLLKDLSHIHSFRRHGMERPANSRHSCAVTRGLQTAP